MLVLGPQASHIPSYASTPFHGSSQVPLNRTFDVSGIPVSNIGNAQDAATIAAEVLAAAVAQASKEFQCICGNPKLPSCGGCIWLMQSSFFGPGERTY